jgi:1-deoxy-D-xylulose-5-phosphate synthase
MSVFGVVPGLRIAAPRDAATVREELREAVGISDGPTIVRFPTGSVPADIPALYRRGTVDILAEAEDDRRDVLLVAVGAFGHLGMDAAQKLTAEGYGVTVVDPRWVRPVPVELVALAREHGLVVTVEDGVRTGGVGDALAKAMRDGGVSTPLRDIGVALDWHPHGSRAEILADLGLTATDVVRDTLAALSDIAEKSLER